jgi:hypothetical protein
MTKLTLRDLLHVLILGALLAGSASAQAKGEHRPLHDYLMPREAEIAMAGTAAPASIVAHATIKVLTPEGYQVARDGQNGFVCEVMRGWSAPTYTPAQFRDFAYDATICAPICFDPIASRNVLPYYELRSRLGMEGKTPDEIADGVEAAYAAGRLPQRGAVSFAYMWSAGQHLGQGIGHWRPHMMVFAPYYDNRSLGGNEFGSPLPQLSDDAGTPFAVVVIPVDPALAVRSDRGTR